MSTFTVLTFLNLNDTGTYISSYAIEYFVLRIILNPKIRFRVDVLSLILLVLFVFYVSQKVLSIVH